MTPQTTLVPGYAWVPPDYVYQPKQVDRPSAQDLKTMREEQIERMVEALTRGPCTITLLQEISGMGKTTVQKWVYGNNRVTSCELPDELEQQPRMKDMGRADVVEPADPALIESAKAAARKGRTQFSAWWKAQTKEARAQVSAHMTELQALCEAADSAKTIDAAPAQAAQDVPEVALDTVVKKLKAATNMDALDVALSWASELTSEDEVKQCEAIYAERQLELGA